jgi:dynactin-5
LCYCIILISIIKSHRVLIGDNVIILDDSNVPPDTVIPSYCVYGGRPATCLQELPETSSLILKEKIFNVYKNFTPKKPEAK